MELILPVIFCQKVAPRNTVGDVPLEWYKDEKHIGYDIAGKKIKKKERQDKLDSFLANVDDSKNWWFFQLCPCVSHVNTYQWLQNTFSLFFFFLSRLFSPTRLCYLLYLFFSQSLELSYSIVPMFCGSLWRSRFSFLPFVIVTRNNYFHTHWIKGILPEKEKRYKLVTNKDPLIFIYLVRSPCT